MILRLWHDDDVEIYVNGDLLFQRGGANYYIEIVLDDSQKAHFREGSNTLAVLCVQRGGGQAIDVGLALSLKK